MNCWPPDFAPNDPGKAVQPNQPTISHRRCRTSPGAQRRCLPKCGVGNAAKAGVSPEKLLTLAAWYEDPRFDNAEQAALALTEAATRLADRPGAVTDEIWAEAARRYDGRQLGALVLMVAITNFFNRLNTTFRVPAGTRWD
jgi:alkylhydroperoxidase family enzyme